MSLVSGSNVYDKTDIINLTDTYNFQMYININILIYYINLLIYYINIFDWC